MTIRRWTTSLRIVACGVAPVLWAASAQAADSTALIRKARKDVVEASIRAPQDPKAASPALRRAVENVEGIRLESKVDPPPSMPDLPPMPVIEPMPVQPLKPASEKAAGGRPAISEAVIARLKAQPAEKVADPLGLADALYLGGRLAEACTFYERVLAGSAGSAATDAKAWAVYQMANCRRSSDPAAAAALYKRVTTEFPKSPWAGVSAAQQRLLEWYQTVGPTTAADAKKPAAGPASAAEAKQPAAAPAPVPETKNKSSGH
jgi:hypothetical protein